jgi:hypothetical protein
MGLILSVEIAAGQAQPVSPPASVEPTSTPTALPVPIGMVRTTPTGPGGLSAQPSTVGVGEEVRCLGVECSRLQDG